MMHSVHHHVPGDDVDDDSEVDDDDDSEVDDGAEFKAGIYPEALL